ncbi:MAG: CBS domain-containing protein [Nocardioides sp.]
MRARELAEWYPIVTLTTDALTAARTMGDQRHPGLIVCDGEGRPHTVLPGTQVLRFMIPSYVQDDPALARVYDERGSDELLTKLSTKTVQDLLPRRQDRAELPVVDPDATTLEVAAVMTRMHSPVVAVVDDDGQVLGAVTLSRLLEVLFPKAPTT